MVDINFNHLRGHQARLFLNKGLLANYQPISYCYEEKVVLDFRHLIKLSNELAVSSNYVPINPERNKFYKAYIRQRPKLIVNKKDASQVAARIIERKIIAADLLLLAAFYNSESYFQPRRVYGYLTASMIAYRDDWLYTKKLENLYKLYRNQLASQNRVNIPQPRPHTRNRLIYPQRQIIIEK